MSSTPSLTLADLVLRRRQAEAELAHCLLCPWRCGADRRGPRSAGRCGVGGAPHWYKAVCSLTEEVELLPSEMRYTAGCNLRCVCCTQAPASQDPGCGQPGDPTELAAELAARVDAGSRSVNLVGGEPGLHPAAWLALAEAAMRQGRRLPLILNTNLYLAPRVLELLDGVIDLYLVDFKFGPDGCAAQLAGAADYWRILTDNLRLLAARPLLIRHLLLPGHLECCARPVAAWVAEQLPRARFSLQLGYVPPPTLLGHPALARPVSRAEADQALRAARQLGLRTTGWPDPRPTWAARPGSAG